MRPPASLWSASNFRVVVRVELVLHYYNEKLAWASVAVVPNLRAALVHQSIATRRDVTDAELITLHKIDQLLQKTIVGCSGTSAATDSCTLSTHPTLKRQV